jgi:hypothetical protein
MIYPTVFCFLTGDHFSPKRLIEKSDLILEDVLEVGQIIPLGMKNKPSEQGQADLVVPKILPEDQDEVDWLANTLAQHHSTMIECGVEEIQLWVSIEFEGICNWYMSAENMKIFGDLNVNLYFSAFQKEGIEETEVAESKG